MSRRGALAMPWDDRAVAETNYARSSRTTNPQATHTAVMPV